MSENIDLTKILKDCPEGTVFWSDNYGKVWFKCIYKFNDKPIFVKRTDGCNAYYTKEGWYDKNFPASCLLWPSKDCRDWYKFTAPWYKKPKFDPKTLEPFDRVLARDDEDFKWNIDIFSYIKNNDNCRCLLSFYKYCIPYNDDTKHLIGTTKEAPEYYRYWED